MPSIEISYSAGRRRNSWLGGDFRRSDRPASSAPAAAKPAAERHLRNIRQLTQGGENAEAYFSPDGTRLIFSRPGPNTPCDQNYTMKIDGSDKHRVSTGTGPDDVRVLLSGRHVDPVCFDARKRETVCPPKPSYDKRLCLADLRRLRHLPRRGRRLEADPADPDAGV